MAYENELFQERVVRVEPPSKHFTLLRAPSGEFLGASDDGLAVFDYVDDKAIWESVEGGTAYRHVVTDLILEAEAADSTDGCYLRHKGVQLAGDGGAAADEGAIFSPGHGPAHLPSEYLKSSRRTVGFVSHLSWHPILLRSWSGLVARVGGITRHTIGAKGHWLRVLLSHRLRRSRCHCG